MKEQGKWKQTKTSGSFGMIALKKREGAPVVSRHLGIYGRGKIMVYMGTATGETISYGKTTFNNREQTENQSGCTNGDGPWIERATQPGREYQ